MSLENYKVATPEQLKRTIGFDGKFSIEVGTTISVVESDQIRAEESKTFKDRDGNPAVTLFFAHEKNGKDVCVTIGSFSKNRVPTGYNVTSTEGEVPANSMPVFNGVKTAEEVKAFMIGSTYKLVCKQKYTGFSQALKQMTNGVAYHWVKQ